MITMTGSLVTLEPLNIEKHAEGYWRVCQDENIHAYTGNSVPASVEETISLLKKYEQFFLNWMILSNETNEVIGLIRLGKPDFENGILIAGESEFLASGFWRKGHMKDAKKPFYRYVFDTLSVEILYADVWEGNTNSIRSLESYGYRRIGTRKEIFPKTGKETLKYTYALTRNAYHARLGQNEKHPRKP